MNFQDAIDWATENEMIIHDATRNEIFEDIKIECKSSGDILTAHRELEGRGKCWTVSGPRTADVSSKDSSDLRKGDAVALAVEVLRYGW